MPPGITPLHISDGVLSGPVLGVGWAITIALLALTLHKVALNDISKISILTAFFFVASLIHLDIGPSSVHLILNGLEGAILGLFSFPAIFVGLLLQALLFAHGGITALGVNAVTMGLPALAAYGTLRVLPKREGKYWRMFNYGALAGVIGVALGVGLTFLALFATSSEYAEAGEALAVWHLPIMGIEGVVVGAAVASLYRIRPDVLPRGLT